MTSNSGVSDPPAGKGKQGEENEEDSLAVLRNPVDVHRLRLMRCFAECRAFCAARAAVWIRLVQPPSNNGRPSTQAGSAALNQSLNRGQVKVSTYDCIVKFSAAKEIPFSVGKIALQNVVVPWTALADHDVTRVVRSALGAAAAAAAATGSKTDHGGRANSTVSAAAMSDVIPENVFTAVSLKHRLCNDPEQVLKTLFTALIVIEETLLSCVAEEVAEREALLARETETRKKVLSLYRQREYTLQLKKRVSVATAMAQKVASGEHQLEQEVRRIALLRSKHDERGKEVAEKAAANERILERLHAVDEILVAVHSQVEVVQDVLHASSELARHHHTAELRELLHQHRTSGGANPTPQRSSALAIHRDEYDSEPSRPFWADEKLSALETRVGVLGRFLVGLSIAKLGSRGHNELLGALKDASESEEPNTETSNRSKDDLTWLLGVEEEVASKNGDFQNEDGNGIGSGGGGGGSGGGFYSKQDVRASFPPSAYATVPAVTADEHSMGIHEFSDTLLNPSHYRYNAGLSQLQRRREERKTRMKSGVEYDLISTIPPEGQERSPLLPSLSGTKDEVESRAMRTVHDVFATLVALNASVLPPLGDLCRTDTDSSHLEQLLFFPAFDLFVLQCGEDLPLPRGCATQRLAFCEYATVPTTRVLRGVIEGHVIAHTGANSDSHADVNWLARYTMTFEDFLLFILDCSRERHRISASASLEAGNTDGSVLPSSWMSDAAILESIAEDVLIPKWLRRLKDPSIAAVVRQKNTPLESKEESVKEFRDEETSEVGSNKPNHQSAAPLPSSVLSAYQRRFARCTSEGSYSSIAGRMGGIGSLAESPVSLSWLDLLANALLWLDVAGIPLQAFIHCYDKEVVEYFHSRRQRDWEQHHSPSQLRNGASTAMMSGRELNLEMKRVCGIVEKDEEEQGEGTALRPTHCAIRVTNSSATARPEGVHGGSAEYRKTALAPFLSLDAWEADESSTSRYSHDVAGVRDGSLEACAAWLGQCLPQYTRLELMGILFDAVTLIARHSFEVTVCGASDESVRNGDERQPMKPHANAQAAAPHLGFSPASRTCARSDALMHSAAPQSTLAMEVGHTGSRDHVYPLRHASAAAVHTCLVHNETVQSAAPAVVFALVAERTSVVDRVDGADIHVDHKLEILPYLLFLPCLVVICALLRRDDVPQQYRVPPLHDLLAALCKEK